MLHHGFHLHCLQKLSHSFFSTMNDNMDIRPMQNRLSILLLSLASGFILSSCTYAQSCGPGSYPPLSGLVANGNVANSYSNFYGRTAIDNAIFGSRQMLPKKNFASYPQYNRSGYFTSAPVVSSNPAPVISAPLISNPAPVISNPVSYGYAAPNYASSPVSGFAPAAPITGGFAAPAPSFIQGLSLIHISEPTRPY